MAPSSNRTDPYEQWLSLDGFHHLVAGPSRMEIMLAAFDDQPLIDQGLHDQREVRFTLDIAYEFTAHIHGGTQDDPAARCGRRYPGSSERGCFLLEGTLTGLFDDGRVLDDPDQYPDQLDAPLFIMSYSVKSRKGLVRFSAGRDGGCPMWHTAYMKLEPDTP